MAKRGALTVGKVLAIGLVVATLSYLFHPDIGHLSFTINGLPLTGAMAKFAALPTFFVILALAVVMTLLVFIGIGFYMLLGSLLLGFIVLTILAPYLWPLLAVLFLVIAIMSLGDGNHKRPTAN